MIKPQSRWRVRNVQALPSYCLEVEFLDGTRGVVELGTLVRSPRAGIFAALADEAFFRQVKVELGVVTWPGEIDLAPDAMYEAIRADGTWAPK